MQTAQIIETDFRRTPHARPVRDSHEWRDHHFNDIGELCRFLGSEIMLSKMKYSEIARLSNVHATTISHLAHNETGQPRASTVLQVLRALGFEVIVRG